MMEALKIIQNTYPFFAINKNDPFISTCFLVIGSNIIYQDRQFQKVPIFIDAKITINNSGYMHDVILLYQRFLISILNRTEPLGISTITYPGPGFRDEQGKKVDSFFECKLRVEDKRILAYLRTLFNNKFKSEKPTNQIWVPLYFL